MHGQMQNSSGDDYSGISGYWVYRISQTDLLRNLPYGWGPLCSIGLLMAPEIDLWHNLPTSMREIWTGSVWLMTSKCQIQIHTYRIDNSRAISSSLDSTTLVERAWQKFWPVNIGRISDTSSKPPLSDSVSGTSRGRHPRQYWFSKIPGSLAREICWSSAGRIPQGRISVKTLHIASQILPGSSDDDSWIVLQLIGCQIGAAGINLRE